MVYMVNSAASRTLATLAKADRLESLDLQFSAGWHERSDREKGRFVSQWGEADWEDAILQGPHLHVSTPLYKAPNSSMKSNKDWSATDFEVLPADARPVTAYKPAGDRAEYDRNYTHWKVPDEHGIEQIVAARDYYRVAWRMMAANTGERTLISGVIPQAAAHSDGLFSATRTSGHVRDLLMVGAGLSSLLSDFSVRAAPKATIRSGVIERLPTLPGEHPLVYELILRYLRLNAVAASYQSLWAECWDDAFLDDAPILSRHDERPVGPEWTEDVPLRRAVDRRNAQVEIDALVALILGVPVEDLCTIYRTQFAVLYGYDKREYTYDIHGRLVPNSILQTWRKRGEPSDNADMPVDERQAEHPGSGVVYTYDLPFGTLDREADFRTAYAEFERRLAAAEAGAA